MEEIFDGRASIEPSFTIAQRRRNRRLRAANRKRMEKQYTVNKKDPDTDEVKAVKKSRKPGRKASRKQFVDEVCIYESTGNPPNSWARKDQFESYVSSQAQITEDERVASRKRLGL